MNRQERQRIESRKLLHQAYHIKENIIKVNRGNTSEHEMAKFLIAWELINNGEQVITEAIFANGKRADVFSLDTCTAYEVLKSESKDDFKKNKSSSYPCQVIPMDAGKVIRSNLESLGTAWKDLDS